MAAAAMDVSSERFSWDCQASEGRNRMNQLYSVKDLAVSKVNAKCLCDTGRLGSGGRSMPVENEAFLV